MQTVEKTTHRNAHTKNGSHLTWTPHRNSSSNSPAPCGPNGITTSSAPPSSPPGTPDGPGPAHSPKPPACSPTPPPARGTSSAPQPAHWNDDSHSRVPPNAAPHSLGNSSKPGQPHHDHHRALPALRLDRHRRTRRHRQ